MRTVSWIAVSVALISASARDVRAQVKDSVERAGVESLLGSLERNETSSASRVGSGERRTEARERGEEARDGRQESRDRGQDARDRGRRSDDRARYDSRDERGDYRQRAKGDARWRRSQEHEMRSCERDLWGRVRRERDRWDDDRYVRSTRDRIRRICERRVYGLGRGWDSRIFDPFGR